MLPSGENAQMKGYLEKIDFFSGLEDKLLNKLAEAAILRQYALNETIVRQGETGLGLYVILKGRVKVEREQGGASVQVAELGAEQAFAEMSIVDDKPRSASVIALEDTECLLLTRDSFVKLMRKYPELPMRTARVLAERLRAANEKLAGGAAAAPAATARAATAESPQAAAGAPSTPAATAESAPAAEGSKAKVQEALLRTFQSLYTLKAFTRFSVAILGCPVEAVTTSLIHEIRIGEVKALLLPGEETVQVDIAAHGSGSFTLHVLVPARAEPVRFGPMAVGPQDRFRLVVASPRVALRQEGRVIAAG